MGKSDLIDKINARMKSQLSSLNPRPANRPRADEKDERGGESGEQRITSTKGTVVVRRRPGPGKGDELPVGTAASQPNANGASADVETASASMDADDVVSIRAERAVSEPEVVHAASQPEPEVRAAVSAPAVEATPAPSAAPAETAARVVEAAPRPTATPAPAQSSGQASAPASHAQAAAPSTSRAEARPAESRNMEPRGGDHARSDVRSAPAQRGEGRPFEGRGDGRSDTRGGEGRGGEGRFGDHRAGDNRSGDNRFGDNRGGEGRFGDNRGGEGRSSDGRFGDNRHTDNRFSDNRFGDNRGNESRGGENRGGEGRGFDRGGFENRGESRPNENRPGDNRFGDNRGGEGRGNFRGGENRGGDFRGGDFRGGENRPDNRGGDFRGGADRGYDRGGDASRFDRGPRPSGNEARVISRPANAPTLEQRDARRQESNRGSGMVTARNTNYDSRGGYQEDNARPVSRSEGHQAGMGGRTEWRPGQDSGLRQASSMEPVESLENSRRVEPLDLEAVLAEERGHVPVKREAQVVGEVRPQSRSHMPPRATSQSATVVRPPAPAEGDAEGGAGETGPGGVRRPAAAGPANFKEIANEERKKEKTIARTTTVGRTDRGRVETVDPDFGRGVKAKKPVVKKKEVIQRRDVVNLEGDIQFRKQRRGAGKKEKEKDKQKPKLTVPKAAKRVIRIEDTISVSELSHRMGTKAPAVIKKLMTLGVMATINQAIDHDTASLVAADFGYEVENVAFDEAAVLADVLDSPENMLPRPPVVTIMGHVDHGKTTLLDAIRDTDVAGKEAGGITQHIGAYKVQTEHGGQVVFLDTPGHEAFTAMRARGAQVTDVVVLVVAADDGVMPQTLEALNHAKAAGVPVLVAVNKIDKPGAQPERIMQKLMEYELVPEEYGGQTIYAKVSAKARLGIKELLELILLQAEVLDLKANPNRQGRATVIESKLDKGRGPVATVLVNSGTLRVGDLVVVGAQYGKVRAMLDDHGKQVKEAGPSTPVEILGLTDVPEAGDTLAVVENLEVAREVAEKRASKAREQVQVKNAKVTLEDLFSQMQKSDTKELKLVLKVDVQGSLEALAKAITELSTDAVKTTILHSGVGNISEGDITLASASGAVVIGFNVKPNVNAGTMAEQLGVEIKTYSVIYDALDELRRAMQGLLRPVQQERTVGHAAVKAVFSIPRLGNIAGCMVTDGKFTRNVLIRLQRNGKQIWEGKVGSLRRGKDDVREVLQGFECGIGLDGYNEIQEGDILVGYQIDEVAATL